MKPATTLRSPAAALLTGLGVCAVLGLAVSQPAFTDDRDLLRFSDSKPYLFILLDTSSSMALKLGAGEIPLVGGSDNPESRLYAAKQAIFNVFAGVNSVHFGFGALNQDHTRVLAKHYLYFNETATPGTWPFSFPATDSNGRLTDYVDKLNLTGAKDGLGNLLPTDNIPDTVVIDPLGIPGEAITLGAMFDFDGGGISAAEQVAGSCASPLPLGALGSIAQTKIDTFAMLNVEGDLRTTTMWLSVPTGSNKGTYRLTVTKPATMADGSTPNNGIGEDNVRVLFDLVKVDSGCSPTTTYPTYDVVLRQDSRMKEYLVVDGAPAGTNVPPSKGETYPNLWPAWSDALASAGCENSKPFSGRGWEGNYDANDPPPAGVTLSPGYPSDQDRFCSGGSCIEIKPVTHTTYSGIAPGTDIGRPMDKGDVLPFDWNNDQKTAFLQRVAPDYDGVSPAVNFSTAQFLTASNSISGYYEPLTAGRAPLIAVGNTPLGKSILDFRCWYEGLVGPDNKPNNKCDASKDASKDGWSGVACTYDAEYGCRKPYLIIISDGLNSCGGEDPTADTAGFNGRTGVKTWALNVGDPKGCDSGGYLHPLTNKNGDDHDARGDACVTASDPEKLLAALQDILGKILEEAHTFASAAVPSVQAIVNQTLFLTDFTPLNDKSRWPGHLNSFLKPLPTDPNTDRPDTSRECSSTQDPVTGLIPSTQNCFVWDAADVLANDQTARDVYFGKQSPSGQWAPNRTVLAPTADSDDDGYRYDLWRAFGLIPATTADGSLPAQESALQTEANAIINTTLGAQTRTACPAGETLCTYKLGDIFHSDPLVFGGSFSSDLIRTDPHDQYNDPTEQCTNVGEMTSAFNRGYRCFATRMGFRRQVVYVGSNDGMIHAFNGGQYQDALKRYDNGTGHELFAYMPRAVMPTVKQITEGAFHHFTVDGPIHAADVFIDSVDDSATFPDPDQRRWRTVLVGGLREGGKGYYALDVTQPDEIDTSYLPVYGSDPNKQPTCHAFKSECGPVAYGSPLWEFNDNTDNQKFTDPLLQPSLPYSMDEDGNGQGDLAFTWSQPDFARVQICGKDGGECTLSKDPASSKDVEEHWVVFFGGGLDKEHKDFDPRTANATDPDGPGGEPSFYELSGNWIYMVDVETGNVLYKRQLCNPYKTNSGNPDNPCVPAGSVPSAISAVDSDLNGFVDRLYVGTTGGFMFRVDFENITTSSGNKQIVVPSLKATIVKAVDSAGGKHTVTIDRIPEEDSAGEPLWQPYAVFDANWDKPLSGAAVAATVPRPIYFAPAVIIYQDAGTYALAFGTGDREDLWNANKQPGRFYVFLDDTSNLTHPPALASFQPPALTCATLVPGAICPTTEADYKPVDLDGTATANNFLLGRPPGKRGWFLVLPANERVITDTFSFSGLTFFSSYQPQVALTDEDGNPLSNAGTCGTRGYDDGNVEGRCSKQGTSSLFLVSTVNANGLLPGGFRTKQVSAFVTNPFTELTTGNTMAQGSGGTPVPLPPIPPEISDLFPSTCRFANARIDISTISSDTSLQRLGSVPICMTTHSWKEF